MKRQVRVEKVQRLVFIYDWGNEAESGTNHVAFEYESKEKFVYDVLEKFKTHEWIFYPQPHPNPGLKRKVFNDFHTSEVELFFGVHLNKYDLEHVENFVYTLDEWFTMKKEQIKVEI